MDWLNRFTQRIQDQIDRVPARGPLSRHDARLWRQVESLEDIGELTARWLEGDIETHPGYYGRPDEETNELVPALATLNRNGYLTIGSQPGLGPVRGYDGEDWWQRAAVDGLTMDDLTADRLQTASTESGLLTARHEGAGWLCHYEDAIDVTANSKGDVHTSFGAHISRSELDLQFDGHLPDAVHAATQLTVVDPEWGRNSLLWPTLVDELVRDRERTDLGDAARERIEISNREHAAAAQERAQTNEEFWESVRARSQPNLELADENDMGRGGPDEPETPEPSGWFAARRASHELSKAFGQLDIYMAEIRGTDRDYPELLPHIIDRIDQLADRAPDGALRRHLDLYDNLNPAATKQDYLNAWQCFKDDLVDRLVEEQLDGIDPLTREDVDREYAASYEPGDDERGGGDDPTDPDGPTPTVDELATDERELAQDGPDEPVAKLSPEVDLAEFEQQPHKPELSEWSEHPEVTVSTDGAEMPTWMQDPVQLMDGELRADDWPESAIRGLGNMRDKGTITEAEYTAAVAYVRDEYGLEQPTDTVELDEPDTEQTAGVSGPASPEQAGSGSTTTVLEAELDEPADSPANQDLEVDDPTSATPTTPELEITEPELDPAESTQEAELDTDGDMPDPAAASEALGAQEITEPELEIDEPESEPEPQNAAWWTRTRERVSEKAKDKIELARTWIRELRSGRHRQVHGAWTEPCAFGGDKECAWQVHMNTTGHNLQELQGIYGHRFVNDVLYRNDVEHQPFDRIADFVENTQLKGRAPELERE